MKYAMKMVLIPEAEYTRLLGGINEKKEKILSGKRDYKAATEMSQLLGRFIRTTKPALAPKVDESQILQHFPALYHDKVSRFLKEFVNYGVSWTDGQLIAKSGEVIGPIVELLKEAFVATRQRRQVPIGWKRFIQEVNNANLSNFFSKKSTRVDLQAERWESF